MIGISFNDKHSYVDFKMILKSKSISLPSAKTSVVNIPGSDGYIDLTASLTNGMLMYDDRKLKFNFCMPKTDWNIQRDNIQNYFQGQAFKIILDSDPDYFYDGRCNISGIKEEKLWVNIEIECIAQPYKYNVEVTQVDIDVNEETTASISCDIKNSLPIITSNSNNDEQISLEYNNTSYYLNNGDNQIADIILQKGDNTLVFNGSGTVSVKFRGGKL